MAKVEVYTARSCPYCNAAKALLRRKGIAFDEIDIGGNWEKRDEMIQRSRGQVTVPQIFIDGLPVGGAAELAALSQTTELDRMLTANPSPRGSVGRAVPARET